VLLATSTLRRLLATLLLLLRRRGVDRGLKIKKKWRGERGEKKNLTPPLDEDDYLMHRFVLHAIPR